MWSNGACKEVDLSEATDAALCGGGRMDSRFTWDSEAKECVHCEGSLFGTRPDLLSIVIVLLLAY
jgi:hypothetical protein